jgi:hypothetical protein
MNSTVQLQKVWGAFYGASKPLFSLNPFVAILYVSFQLPGVFRSSADATIVSLTVSSHLFVGR